MTALAEGPVYGIVYVQPDGSIRIPLADLAAIKAAIEIGAAWVRFREFGGDMIEYRTARIDGFARSTPDSRARSRELRRITEGEDDEDERKEAWR